MKQLIINADDFGLSKSVNCGIIYAHRNGIVTSATLMANMPGFEDAVARAKENPELGVGVHLNLCRGNPLLPPVRVPSLIDSSGRFWTPGQLLRKIYLHRISPGEAEAEWKTQVARVRDAGIEITHLDSEKHFHVFPILDQVFVRVAQHFQISSVRLPAERHSGLSLLGLLQPQFYKQMLLARRAKHLGSLLRKHGLRFPEHFFGVILSRNFTLENLRKLFQKIPDGIIELMVHPGFVDVELRRLANVVHYKMVESRQGEVDVLTSPELKTALKKFGIQLTDFRSL